MKCETDSPHEHLFTCACTWGSCVHTQYHTAVFVQCMAGSTYVCKAGTDVVRLFFLLLLLILVITTSLTTSGRGTQGNTEIVSCRGEDIIEHTCIYSDSKQLNAHHKQPYNCSLYTI